MIYAAAQGKTSVMNYLLDHGIDVQSRYKHELDALMWAAGYGQLEAVKALLERGPTRACGTTAAKLPRTSQRDQRQTEVAAYLERDAGEVVSAWGVSGDQKTAPCRAGAHLLTQRQRGQQEQQLRRLQRWR